LFSSFLFNFCERNLKNHKENEIIKNIAGVWNWIDNQESQVKNIEFGSFGAKIEISIENEI
jgi:biotin synthase-related radical SAM superfamily protein